MEALDFWLWLVASQRADDVWVPGVATCGLFDSQPSWDVPVFQFSLFDSLLRARYGRSPQSFTSPEPTRALLVSGSGETRRGRLCFSVQQCTLTPYGSCRSVSSLHAPQGPYKAAKYFVCGSHSSLFFPSIPYSSSLAHSSSHYILPLTITY